MNYPESLLELDPIPQILSFNCQTTLPTEGLYKNLPDILIPVLIGKLKDREYCFSQVIRLCMDRNTDEVDICKGYRDIALRCQLNQSRFILYLIDLVFLEGQQIVGRHSEALLIDTLFQTIEFFEPNGPAAQWYPVISSFLEYKFSSILPTYKFLTTGEFCPFIGPQAVSELGICGSFSLLFIILRVSNPDLTSGEVISELVNLSRSQIQTLMRQFICFIVDYASRNQFRLLQNLYDRLVDATINIPELVQTVDDLYYNLDRQALLEFAQNYGIL